MLTGKTDKNPGLSGHGSARLQRSRPPPIYIIQGTGLAVFGSTTATIGSFSPPPTLGARIVRYADDIVILCRYGTERPMTKLRQILEQMNLTLNEAKTRMVDAYKGKFDFLGFTIWIGKGARTGNYYPNVQPSKRSLQTIKDRITKLTARERTIMPLERVVNEVNATVRGWVGYFHYRNCSQTLSLMRYHLEQRLITHLRKRHKVRNWKTGYVRFPHRSLYERYGLYKVPKTAAWKKAHA